jgi:hypothetical protein
MKIKHIENMQKGFYFIRKMYAGDSLGDKALRSKNKQRTATVVCSEDSHFLCLNELSYSEILSNISFYIWLISIEKHH